MRSDMNRLLESCKPAWPLAAALVVSQGCVVCASVLHSHQVLLQVCCTHHKPPGLCVRAHTVRQVLVNCGGVLCQRWLAATCVCRHTSQPSNNHNT